VDNQEKLLFSLFEDLMQNDEKKKSKCNIGATFTFYLFYNQY